MIFIATGVGYYNIRPLAPVIPHRKFIFYVDAKAELGNKKATIDTQIISKSSLKKRRKNNANKVANMILPVI